MIPVHLTDFANDLYLVLEILDTYQLAMGSESYISLSQQDIANLANCSRPKINQLMKELTDRGYVQAYQKMRGKYQLTQAGQKVLRIFREAEMPQKAEG